MTTREAAATLSSVAEEDSPLYFNEWLQRRRKDLDLTQAQLAHAASCTVFTIRKIETGERRPSRQLAELLAKSLEIPPEDQTTFIKVARGELGVERLESPVRASRSAGKSPTTPGNLPRSLTPFIGRESELAALADLLQDPQCPLLTIVGPGGIGKTRLAVEAARHVQDLFPDGIWFVPLASLNSPALILPAIAEALDFRFKDSSNPQAQLLGYLCEKKALLILDNAEHLLDDLGVFTAILTNCQQVKLLVTSRERLNLLSEWVFEIQGLPVPPGDHLEQAEEYSATALFLQTARRIQVGFEVREEERQWVVRICRVMEGMPLGIELSAAWVGLLSIEAIAKEIEHNLDFLSVSMRDLPERHRSLRATLDHSWKLLTPDEKSILSRLAVFHGSFSPEAAREVCGAGLAVLSSLRNKSLLHRTGQEDYALHEIIRQYAELKLSEDPAEDGQVKDRHAAYFVQYLSECEQSLQSSHQVETFDAMAKDIDNLSRGWQHMLTNCHPTTGKNNQFCADMLHGALFSLSLFYEMRCRSWEAIPIFMKSVKYLKSVQGEFEKTKDRSRFNSVLGHITAYLGLHHAAVLQYAQARAHLEEAILLLEISQSRVERAQAQIILASIYYRQGRYRKSVLLLEQSRNVLMKAGERWWYLLSLIHLARTYLPLGKLQECEAFFQKAFRLVEPGDLRLELTLRNQFAMARCLQKDYVQAEQLMQDNLQLSHHFGNLRMTANIYIDLSKVMLATDRVELAEEYLRESIKLLREFGKSDDLAYGLLHLGKCFVSQSQFEDARREFRQVIKIGQTHDLFYLVYWALVNIAGTYRDEGDTEKALEILLVLRDSPVEHKEAKDEGDRLLTDLQAGLPEWQVEAAGQLVEGKNSPDQAIAYALEVALGFEYA